MTSQTRHLEVPGAPQSSQQEECTRTSETVEERYHVFTYRQKFLIVILVSCAATFSPLASNIYFPALELISEEMNASKEEMALTITVYMIAQGIAPSLWGPISDCIGRRQVLIWTLLLFHLTNIALALAPTTPLLTALRALQALASSATISLGAGVIADIAPAAERGGFTGAFAGVRQVSVAVGPVVGGGLAGALGFRAVFWFLAASAAAVVAAVAAFLPETLRRVAGDGRVELRGWRYEPVWRAAAPWRVTERREASLRQRGREGGSAASSRRGSVDGLVRRGGDGDVEMLVPSSCGGSSRRGSDSSSERSLRVKGQRVARPLAQEVEGPGRITWRIFFEPARFLLEKDIGCTLFFGAVVYTVFSMVTSSTTFLLADHYGLNTVQIGFCFLPNGIGCALGSYISGLALDRDFSLASLTHLATDPSLPAASLKQKSTLPFSFPLERARLSQLPLAVSIFVFGVVLYGFSFSPSATAGPAHLAVPLLAQFAIGLAATAVLNVNNTLTVDLYPGKGAAAAAVNNLARCLVGAVGVAVIEIALARAAPVVVFGILAGVVVAASPAVWAEWVWGQGWRRERAERMARKEEDEVTRGSRRG